MSLWKKAVLAIAGFVLLTGFSVSALRVGDQLKLFVNQLPVELGDEYELLHVGDRLYVPLRFFGERLGMIAYYDEERRDVHLSEPLTVRRSVRSATAAEGDFTLTLYEGTAYSGVGERRREGQPSYWAELRYSGEGPIAFSSRGLPHQLIQFEFDASDGQTVEAAYFDIASGVAMLPDDVAMAVAPPSVAERHREWGGRNMKAVCELYIGERKIILQAVLDTPQETP